MGGLNENDFRQLRARMVDAQLIARGINDRRVLDAFLKVPRHKFVPLQEVESAYEDYPLPIGEGQTISQPYIVALMTQSLELKDTDIVLEIGTGSGYQAAILAELVKKVYTIERIPALTENVSNLLRELGYKNIELKTGDGTLGLPEDAPYDGIIVTAAAPEIPKPLIEQLNDNGRLVVPTGGGFSQMLTVLKKTSAGIVSTDICGCVFVPLIGRYGWKG